MNMEEVTCSFCRGKGIDPFDIMSMLSTCCVCGGRKLVRIKAPFTQCAHCLGTGAVKTLTCTVCRGKGFVTDIVGPAVVCSECNGTGDDASVSALPCLQCRGHGRVSET